MKTVKEKLQLLRIKMKENNISAYIVCTQDFHGSEYVGDYFKEREYLSGFTGSAETICFQNCTSTCKSLNLNIEIL